MAAASAELGDWAAAGATFMVREDPNMKVQVENVRASIVPRVRDEDRRKKIKDGCRSAALWFPSALATMSALEQEVAAEARLKWRELGWQKMLPPCMTLIGHPDVDRRNLRQIGNVLARAQALKGNHIGEKSVTIRRVWYEQYEARVYQLAAGLPN